MKSLLFFISSIFCCLPFFRAQSTYYKMLGKDNSWFISGYYYVLGVENSSRSAGSLGTAGQGQYRAEFDSTVNGKTYKLFVHSPSSGPTLGTPMVYCLVREDTITQRIFVIPKDSAVERVVIDFSLNPADSIFLTYPNGNTILNSGYYKVDSVRYRNITAGTRKHIYLTNRFTPINYVTGKRFFIEWIESVGAAHFPVNIIDQEQSSSGWKPQSDWMLACGKQQLGSFVACKLTNGEKIYHDSCSYNFAVDNYGVSITVKSTCNYYVYYFQNGIEEIKSDFLIHTYPSPASKELIIEGNLQKPGIEKFEIYDIVGQKYDLPYLMYEGRINLDINALKPGVYSLSVSTLSGGQVAKTFIKINED